MGGGGPAVAREKYQRELRHRVLPAARIFAAGTDPGGGRVDVPVQASGREYRFDRGPFRSQRSQEMETRRAGGVSRGYVEEIVFHRAGGVRRNLFAAQTIYGIAGADGTADGQAG